MLSLSFIIANFSDPTNWQDIRSRTLSDGTRLCATRDGGGFRVYRPAGSGTLPAFVPFS